MTNKRIFRGTDIELLTASSTIIDNAITYKSELIAKRSVWADPYFDNLKIRNQTVINDYLGIDNAKTLRSATSDMVTYYNSSILFFMEIKIQIKTDFQKDKLKMDNILKNLGYVTYNNNGKRPSRLNMIKWLFLFKNNLSQTLRDELVAKGIDDTSIAKLIDNAEYMKKVSQIQSSLKSNLPVLTQTTNDELNNLYMEVINIAKIASNIFRDNKVVKAMFSYNKALQQIGVSTKSKTQEAVVNSIASPTVNLNNSAA